MHTQTPQSQFLPVVQYGFLCVVFSVDRSIDRLARSMRFMDSVIYVFVCMRTLILCIYFIIPFGLIVTGCLNTMKMPIVLALMLVSSFIVYDSSMTGICVLCVFCTIVYMIFNSMPDLYMFILQRTVNALWFFFCS